MGIFIVPRCR